MTDALVFSGMNFAITPYEAINYANTTNGNNSPGARGAQLSVIPRAGHLVAFEQPDAFDRVLTEWLASRIEKT